jgi:protein-disulfide isomerase
MEHQTLRDKPIIESRTSFYLGLAVGIAGVSIIALLAIGGSYVKGNFSSNNNSDGSVANIKTTNTADTANGNAAGAAKVAVTVNKNDHIRGNKNAKITIVEFSDIECPYCSRFHETMKQIMKAYPNDVRWVFKQFPLESMHPFARKAAEGAECAGDQGKFWEYIDKLYENQSSLSNEYIKSAALEIGLNADKFNSCLDSGKFKDKVDADMKYGQSLNVRGTPGSFINGIAIPGAVPFSTVDEMVRSQL